MSELVGQPLFGVAITVLFYVAALSLQKRWQWLHPLFLTAGGLIVFLLAANISYEDYRVGGDVIAFFLGPATVALGVPLYKQAAKIRRNLAAILAGVTVGAVSGLLSAGILVTLLHGGRELLLSMLPKSATTPISIEIVRQLGGIPELGAVLTVLTGLLGSMFGPEILRLCGIRGDVPIGIAIGTASHGIGTARVLRDSELQGSMSGLAMGLNGVATSLLVIPLYWWYGY